MMKAVFKSTLVISSDVILVLVFGNFIRVK